MYFFFGHSERTLADYVAWRNTLIACWQNVAEGREAPRKAHVSRGKIA
jgi:hypothetical protein